MNYCTVYNVHYTLYTVHCTVYNRLTWSERIYREVSVNLLMASLFFNGLRQNGIFVNAVLRGSVASLVGHVARRRLVEHWSRGLNLSKNLGIVWRIYFVKYKICFFKFILI